jgi:hypothetical protein
VTSNWYVECAENKLAYVKDDAPPSTQGTDGGTSALRAEMKTKDLLRVRARAGVRVRVALVALHMRPLSDLQSRGGVVGVAR